MHGCIGTAGNATALRLLYYPPLPEESNIKPGQVRCGEHSDYGSITLLFQDSVGGLEVRIVLNLSYHPAKYLKMCERFYTTAVINVLPSKCRRFGVLDGRVEVTVSPHYYRDCRRVGICQCPINGYSLDTIKTLTLFQYN